MTKLGIVKRIANKTDLDATKVKQVVQLLLDGMVEALARGERLEWRELGVFEVRVRKGRQARNPRTGASVMVPARKAVCFWAGKVMREKIEAAEADPANFRDYARKWREEREARPEAPPTPPAGQEPGTSLGALSTELFGETPQRNNRMSQSKTEGAKP